MRSNASFKHLGCVNIVSQLENVRYEISIHFVFLLDFLQKYKKKREPKYEDRLPYNNTEGLAICNETSAVLKFTSI